MGDAEGLTGGLRRLDPRYVAAERITGAIVLAVVTVAWIGGLTLVWSLDAIARWIDWLVTLGGGAAVVLLIWQATAYPAISYRHWAYRLDEAGLEVRSGVFFRSIVNVPRSRVQHTDVTQGPIERRFGLGTLIVHTAGTDYAMVSLPGLPHDIALWARDALLPKDGRDAV